MKLKQPLTNDAGGRHRRVNRVCRLAILCVASSLLFGCGTDHPETVPVSGRITVNGGPVPAAGRLRFAPVEAAPGYSMRPGVAAFDIDGRFTAQTWQPGDGLTPGKYVVSAECWQVAPTMDESEPQSYFPARYLSGATSGWQLHIVPGAAQHDVSFDVAQP